MMRVGALAVLFALSGGCQAQVEEGEVAACDPLAAGTEPVALAAVVGAGQDAAGVIYLVDRDGYDLRAFVSEAGELFRQRVSGSGELNGTDEDLVSVSLSERDPPLNVEVATASDGSRRMGVFAGMLDTKTFVIGTQGEELTLLTSAEVSALPIHNYPAEVVVNYAAELEDGRLLVVLMPRDFSDYMEARVFFGPPDHLDERKLISFVRQRDGGTTNIEFEVDGARGHAFFPVELVNDQFMPGPPELSLDEESVPLELLDAQSPQNASYYCRG